jgi:hypothetical protein
VTVDTERSWSWPKLRGVVVVAGVRSVDGTIHHIRVSRSRLIDLMANGFPISVPIGICRSGEYVSDVAQCHQV